MSGDMVPSMGLDKQIVVTEEQKELVKKTVTKGATDDELKLFIYDCTRRGVHPLDGMIHFVKRGGKEGDKATHQPSIDFFRSRAEASGLYDGQDEPEYEYEGKSDHPTVARVRVYKKGVSRPIVGVARWAEFCPSEKMAFMWKKMPTTMLAKCAEAQALRKAFPQLFAGLYIHEEMAQADAGPTYDTHPTKTDTVRSAVPGDTVTSGGGAPETSGRPSSDEPKNDTRTPNETLKDELGEFCGGDLDLMTDVLKEVTYFKDSKGEEKWVKPENIEKISAKWAGKALGNLRKKVEKIPADCTANPVTCAHSGVDNEGVYWCGSESCNFEPR